MSLFGKKKPEPTIRNEDMIDSSKCNFLLSNGICGATTYGIMRRCAKDKCIFMQLLEEKRKNLDYVPEPERLLARGIEKAEEMIKQEKEIVKIPTETKQKKQAKNDTEVSQEQEITYE